MTITLAVKNLSDHICHPGPFFVAGRLWLDAVGARLYDLDEECSVALADPEACAVVRAVLPAPSQSGPMVPVRPVPPQYDYVR